MEVFNAFNLINLNPGSVDNDDSPGLMQATSGLRGRIVDLQAWFSF